MRLRMNINGAKWGIVALQLVLLFNSGLVKGVEDTEEMLLAEESRSPYVVLSQTEYLVKPNGDFQEVTSYPAKNASDSYSERLKQAYVENYNGTEEDAYADEESTDDQTTNASFRSQTFENPYVRFSINNNDGEEALGQASSLERVSSIQDVLGHRQGEYEITSSDRGYSGGDAGTKNAGATGPAPSYNSNAYANYPQTVSYQGGYDGPSNHYFGPTASNYDWPSPSPGYGVTSQGFPGGGFLSGIGHVTSSVKQVKTQLGEQKAKAAYQVSDAIRNTGHAATAAIINNGNTAAHIVGNTINTAGNVLKTKGDTVTRVIQGSGQLASSALRSAGNVGASVLRAKGEFVGAVLKTKTALAGAALNTASNGLAKGTYLVKAKGDAVSNVIAKGGNIATGVIGTKGRLISSVITAKNQFAANLIEAKGRAVGNLLETGGQKLNQLADAIKAATVPKDPGFGNGGYGGIGGYGGSGLNYGWSETEARYASPPLTTTQTAIVKDIPKPASRAPAVTTVAAKIEPEVVIQPSLQQQQHHHTLDYADAYYDPKDVYYSPVSNHRVTKQVTTSPTTTNNNDNQNDDQASDSEQELSKEEELQNDYSSYYTPHQNYQVNPRYYRKYEWE